MDVVHGENGLRKLPNLQIVASQTGHALDNHGGDFSRLHQSHHLLESISVHGDTGNTIVHENANILEFVPPGVIQKKGLLRRDLSRYVFAKECAIRIDKQQKERYNNAVIDNDVII